MLLDAGVVHQHVEPAERVGAARDQVAHVGDRPEIGLNDGAAAPQRLDLGQRLLGAFGIAVVVDDDVGAFLGEADGNAAADALAAAGDEHLSAEQPVAAEVDRCGERGTIHAAILSKQISAQSATLVVEDRVSGCFDDAAPRRGFSGYRDAPCGAPKAPRPQRTSSFGD